MNRGFLPMASAVALAALTGSARAERCPRDAANELQLDAAASGYKRECRFRKRDTVTVKVVNRNPFRFTYKLVVNDTPVAEPDLKPIAGMLKPSEAKPGDTPAEGQPPGEVERGAVDMSKLTGGQRALAAGRPTVPAETYHQWVCGEADPEWQLLGATDASLAKLATEANSEVSKLRDVSGAVASKHAALIKTIERSKPPATDSRDALDDFAEALDKQRKATADARGVKGALDHLERTAAEQTRALDDFRKQHPACASFHAQEWAGYYARAAFWEKRFAPEYLREIGEHEAAFARFEQIRDQVAAILGRPDAFETSYVVGPFEKPTDVAVELERTDKKGGDPETIADLDLNFGGRERFAFTTGLVATEVEKLEFGKVTALVSKEDKPEEMEKATLVGYKERSDWRTSVMALAHVRVKDWDNPDTSVFLSFGAASGGDVFGGASLGLAENRAFLTVGVYGAKIDELEGGLEPGDRLPDSFTEDLPLRKAWRWKVGFGLTVKVGG